MKQLYILGLYLLSLSPLSSLSAETLHYDVYHGNTHVGTMKVEKRQEQDKEVLSSYGKVEVSLIFTLELEFIYRAEFQAGQLLSSLTKNLRGGDLTDMSSGYQQGDTYHNRVNDKILTASLPIRYTILSMYFEEPVGLNKVYSERVGAFLPIRPKGEHHYEITQVNGNISRYTYQNGICKLLEVDHSLATLQFRLRS